MPWVSCGFCTPVCTLVKVTLELEKSEMQLIIFSKQNQSFWSFSWCKSVCAGIVCFNNVCAEGIHCCNMASIWFMKGLHCILKLQSIIYLRFWKIWAVSCKVNKHSIRKKYQKREGFSFWLKFSAVDTLRWGRMNLFLGRLSLYVLCQKEVYMNKRKDEKKF